MVHMPYIVLSIFSARILLAYGFDPSSAPTVDSPNAITFRALEPATAKAESLNS